MGKKAAYRRDIKPMMVAQKRKDAEKKPRKLVAVHRKLTDSCFE